MGSTEAILSAQLASQLFNINKFIASPVPQMQKQSDGSGRQAEKKEMNNKSDVKIVGKQRQQQQQLKPRFALELDGLNCFETLVPL
ncbi:Pyruvate dehydrogenase E1 component subunit alpha [Hordeum vulgare]|nr:Pyruvate dehydrogenase E1 component subunit alpha [Hordeum vulgare]